jgi:hypothetical protein
MSNVTKIGVMIFPASQERTTEGKYGPRTFTVGTCKTADGKEYSVFGKPGEGVSLVGKDARVLIKVLEEPPAKTDAVKFPKGKAEFIGLPPDELPANPIPPAGPVSQQEPKAPAMGRAEAAQDLAAIASATYRLIAAQLATVNPPPTSEDIRTITNTILIKISQI